MTHTDAQIEAAARARANRVRERYGLMPITDEAFAEYLIDQADEVEDIRAALAAAEEAGEHAHDRSHVDVKRTIVPTDDTAALIAEVRVQTDDWERVYGGKNYPPNLDLAVRLAAALEAARPVPATVEALEQLIAPQMNFGMGGHSTVTPRSLAELLAARFTLPVVPTVTEEMVERGAKAIFAAVDTSHEWEHGLADWRRDRARSASRAALSAALTPEAGS